MQERYSDAELSEFKQLINEKLEKAEEVYRSLKESLSKSNNGTDDTGWTFNILEDGQSTLSREETGILSQKQEKFIHALRLALERIESKTYGVCMVTGNLIPKQRLLAVPHTTVSISNKN